MSQDTKKNPGGGESPLSEELKAQLALLARARKLGMLGDLTASIKKAEVDARVAATKGAVQKAYHVLVASLKSQGITSARLVVDWDKDGKPTHRYGPKRASTASGGDKTKFPMYDGVLYESTKKLADAFGGMPGSYAYCEATWLKRSRKAGKVLFVWVEKAAALKAVADGVYAMAEGNTIE